MKVTHGTNKGFVPFTIYVETEADAAILFALCNHSSIIEGVQNGLEFAKEIHVITENDYEYGFNLRSLRDEVEKAFIGGATIPYNPIHTELCYQFSKDYSK